MKRLVAKFRPSTGFSPLIHAMYNLLFAVAVLMLVNTRFTNVALAIVLLGKWRMLAVKPRYWLANVRSNLMDISVGLSVIVFIGATDTITLQILWSALYAAWLIGLKPRSDKWSVMFQAGIGQLLGLTAFYWQFRDASVTTMMVAAWVICYCAARHYFTAYDDEPLAKTTSHIWGLFAAELGWVLGHWIIFYNFLPQLGLILTVLGYGLGAMYYLYKSDKLTSPLRLQFVLSLSAFIIIVIALSDWQDKTI